MNALLPLIPLLPLLGFAIIILNGKRLGSGPLAPVIAIGASTLSAVLAVPIWGGVLFGHADPSISVEWIRFGDVTVNMGFFADGVGALTLFMVTIVGTMIFVFAKGYMGGEENYSRFFAYVSLFLAGMLGLVLADNLLLLFVSWEIMGLCSYLLIGFYVKKPSANAASIKAFITTRIGDVGLMLGIFLLWWTTGTISFKELAWVVPALWGQGLDYITLGLTVSAVLIFVGTIGKSAQFPLHVWLPDAMEGPTPVSALIHAATMVAAGVFLVARCFMIFNLYPSALFLVAVVGCFTALFAALIALTQNDIKRVLAYSTLSQLGYMVMALGLGSYGAGMFHLITHAFFKALLFLGAGSVIHGFHHIQDMRQMGGLARKMPTTHWTFLAATLAIAGFPMFSGFWSKDEILLTAFQENKAMWAIGTFTAFLTAFYMFRLYFMTFTGKQRDTHVEAHESPRVMTFPLVVLAIFAILIGLPGSHLMGFWLQGAIHPSYLPHHPHSFSMSVATISTLVGVAGFLLAWAMYSPKPRIQPSQVAEAMGPLYRLSYNKFYIDEIYQSVIIRPTLAVARFCRGMDMEFVDALVNGTGRAVRSMAAAPRVLTAGNVQWYAITILLGAVGLALLALGTLF